MVTGHWGKTALKQAAPYVATHIAATSEADGFRSIPARNTWQFAADSAYVHITANETIHGVEFREIPDVGDTPLVADFSSSIASEPLDVSRFGIIYAGAQKNLGPVGISVVIVRRDLLERAGQPRADIFDTARKWRVISTRPTEPNPGRPCSMLTKAGGELRGAIAQVAAYRRSTAPGFIATTSTRPCVRA